MTKTSRLPRYQHANTLPAANSHGHTKAGRSLLSGSSSSSSSGSSPAVGKLRRVKSDWKPGMMKQLNRDYEPVYKLRRVSSMTQTEA